MKTIDATRPPSPRAPDRCPRRPRLRRSFRPLAGGAVAAAALAWSLQTDAPEVDAPPDAPHRAQRSTARGAASAAPAAHAPVAVPQVDPVPGSRAARVDAPAFRYAAMARRLKALYPQSADHGADIVRIVHEAAAHHRLDPCLVMGVIARESSFRPAARNRRDTGLMQVNVDWHPELVARAGGRQALLDPARNVRAGTELLAHYRSRSGSDHEALQRYHGLGKRNGYVRWVQAETRRLRAAGTCGAEALLASADDGR